MDINEFIKNFADQFEETELSEFTAETKFRELEEWESLTALAILNMIAKKYGVKLPHKEMRQTFTIQELFDLVQSKLA